MEYFLESLWRLLARLEQVRDMKQNGFGADTVDNYFYCCGPECFPGGVMVYGVTTSQGNTYCDGNLKSCCFLMLHLFQEIWDRKPHIFSWHPVLPSIRTQMY